MPDYVRDTTQIGRIIHEYRLKRRLSGLALGHQAGISQSKISKIENGYYAKLRAGEVEKILNILEVPQPISQQVLAALQLLSPTEYPQRYRQPVWEGSSYERERDTTHLRAFMMNATPSLLQPIEYHQAVLRHQALTPKQFSHSMAELVRRQDLLWDLRRQFHFIMPETALYTLVADRETQLVQLDRIERFVGSKRVKIGIIPYESGLLKIEVVTFVLYDNRTLVQVVPNYETVLKDPRDIAEYSKLFRDLEHIAAYGETARALLRKAVAYFS